MSDQMIELAECSCAEIAGEDPRCIRHGEGTMWRKENPDLCDFSERYADMKVAYSILKPRIEQLEEALRRTKRLIGMSLDHGARVMSDQALGEALKGIEAALNPQQDGGE